MVKSIRILKKINHSALSLNLNPEFYNPTNKQPMSKQSAGILLYKHTASGVEVLLVHPGGPFFAKKDTGAWSVPKGEFEENEVPFAAAKREFKEETGMDVNGDFFELTPVKLKSGKKVFVWALKGDLDPAQVVSNTFEMEWPPKSGSKKSFPEIDKAAWFSIAEAKEKINTGQLGILEQLEKMLADVH
ncbi:MAG: hypothetical protein JWP12_1868 [Bacteroidetes bacterium]|nr:hypothetical protein [Bacteroidota bacterium]